MALSFGPVDFNHQVAVGLIWVFLLVHTSLITYISDDERNLVEEINGKIDAFAREYEGKPFAVLVSRPCKRSLVDIQSKVGLQTHAWKLLMIVMLDPLDLMIHVRKYCAGQLNNNVVQIALKIDLEIPDSDESDLRVIEQGSPEDGFSDDLDPAYRAELATLLCADRVATQDGGSNQTVRPDCGSETVENQESPIVASAPSMQSTVLVPEPVIEVTLAVDSAPPTSPPSMTALPNQNAASGSKTPKNPRKKLKLQLDRDVALDLARSLNSFASMLQLKDSSSDDSFEVLPDSDAPPKQ